LRAGRPSSRAAPERRQVAQRSSPTGSLRTLPDFRRQLLRRPPKMKPVRHEEILSARVILPVGLTRPAGRDGGADQALHLVAEARDGSPVAACGLKSKLRHEARKRGAKLQLSIPGSDGFGCHPDENQARIAAVRQAGPADIRDAEVRLPSVRTYCVPDCSLCGRVVWTRNFAMKPSAPASRALSVGSLHDRQHGWYCQATACVVPSEVLQWSFSRTPDEPAALNRGKLTPACRQPKSNSGRESRLRT
jgi:hypothetical protein